MNGKLNIKVRASHIVALVALLAAFGGTAYAGATVGSAQIKNNAVRSIDVRNGTLNTDDVKDMTLRTSDLSKGTYDELTNKWRIDGTMVTAPGGAHVEGFAYCDHANGEYAAGGGGYSYYAGKGYITGTTPIYGTGENANKPIGWEVDMQNIVGTTNYLVVRVTCVKG